MNRANPYLAALAPRTVEGQSLLKMFPPPSPPPTPAPIVRSTGGRGPHSAKRITDEQIRAMRAEYDAGKNAEQIHVEWTARGVPVAATYVRRIGKRLVRKDA
jgi:hypothetical protein